MDETVWKAHNDVDEQKQVDSESLDVDDEFLREALKWMNVDGSWWWM